MNQKQCTICCENKNLMNFYPKQGGKFGVSAVCRVCQSQLNGQWRLKNQERKKELDRLYRKNYLTPEKKSEYNLRYRIKNSASNSKARKKWYLNNKDYWRKYAQEHGFRRCALVKKATPSWADLKQIAKIYSEAKYKTKTTGVVHHVDHIVPLRGKNVCGLHCENNLQILTASENLKKGNK